MGEPEKGQKREQDETGHLWVSVSENYWRKPRPDTHKRYSDQTQAKAKQSRNGRSTHK